MRVVLGFIILVVGLALAALSVVVSIEQVSEAEDRAAAVEAAVILALLCLLLAAFGFRLIFPARSEPTCETCGQEIRQIENDRWVHVNTMGERHDARPGLGRSGGERS